MLNRNQSQLATDIIKSQQGFSILEILIGLMLIALAGTFVATKVLDRLEEGRQLTATTQIRKLGESLEDFRRHCGFYPTAEQGLDALIEKPTGGRECKRYAPGGYISSNRIPADPWETEYEYQSDGRSYTIISFGADGMEGGEGFDADINSNDL
jgi:general secretion pathway protein G